MTSIYAFFLVALAFPMLFIIIVDVLFLNDIRDEKIRIAKQNGAVEHDIARLSQRPNIIVWARSMAPWILAIFAVRAFIYEPFTIPSTSMMPQLKIGDSLVVEKFAYGLRDPLFQRVLIDTQRPERGDVAVFKNPESPGIDYIKRVIGLPGDKITYFNKSISISPACPDGIDCQETLSLIQTPTGEMKTDSDGTLLALYHESYNDKTYTIALSDSKTDNRGDYFDQRFTSVGEFIVPARHYFMMGDNRDNSRDSRFFGFVSEEALVGKAVLNAVNIEHESTHSWLPDFIPTNISLAGFAIIE